MFKFKKFPEATVFTRTANKHNGFINLNLKLPLFFCTLLFSFL